ncbi:calpastatin isoform X6 [Scyliorhinus torazame]|uniref:calpastatin isoform X6 n=1 Tax=Scyliorhinus torazame TaxID=75743 RepID=UPI003B591EFC
MSQPNKRKGKEPRKGGKKPDSTKSSKQGASMSAQASEGGKKPDSTKSSKQGASMSVQASEEKPKVSQLAKTEGSKSVSSTSKDKATSGHSAKSSGDTYQKQQQAQTAVSQQDKMGLGWTKTAEVDTKETSPAKSPSISSTSIQKTTDPKLQAPVKASTAVSVSAGKSDAKGEDPFDLLAGTLPSEAPDNSAPIFTGPEVKESDATKTKAERVGEKEESIPPDYRFKEQPDPKDKGKVASSSTGPGSKPKATEKSMTEGDILESLSADFTQTSPALISKCSAPTSHSAALPSKQPQEFLKASTAAPVSADKSAAKDEDPFDLLAGTLPSEAPDNSGPKFTGPPVKESDATKKKAERVGEKEESIPPDYRFKEQPDPKDKGKVASSSTGPGAKPKATEKKITEGDILDSLSADFTQISPAPISKSSAATSHSAAPPSKQPQKITEGDILDSLSADFTQISPAPISKSSAATSHSAAPLSKQPQKITEGDILDSLSADFTQISPAPISKSSAATSHSAAPPSKQPQALLKASTAAPVSAGKSDAKGEDPFDLLMGTLPSEAPANSGPKYTGPSVKESDATKKKPERVGETEESIPPDYRFKEQPDPKDKGKVASSSTGPGAKSKVTEKNLTEGDVLESLSADFTECSSTPISKCAAPTSHSAAPPSKQPQGDDPFDLLAGTLPSEAPDNSGPKFTGPPVKESDATKKKAERVGEKEESIPPDYRFKEQPDSKDKGKVASSSTGPGAKPKGTEKSMTEGDVLDTLSADFIQRSPAPISKCSAPTSHSAAPPSKQPQALLKASKAAPVSAGKSDAKGEDPFDLLAGSLPSQAPDNSGPKYTGPPVKESDATKKKAERVGEKEESIPPDYRFKEQPDSKDKGKVTSSSIDTGAKPKRTEKKMAGDDVLESLSADFVKITPASISKCSAPTSQMAAPRCVQKEAPLEASKAASVSASKSGTKDEDPFDLLAGTLPSQAPDNSGPKYTGPPVKESDATKKKAERVGEKEESIPPDYRFKEQPDPKDKGKVASSSTGPGAKPKATEKSMTEGDVLDTLSADFIQRSAAPISKCSAPTSHSAAPPSLQPQGQDPFDLLADTLPSEASANSAHRYTGPEVKESDVTKTKAERVGEKEESIPPDYRFKEQPDPKDKGKVASSSTSPGAKPKVTEKSMTEGDVLDSLSADFINISPAPISKCSAPTSHAAAPPSMQKEAPLTASTAAPVSASKSSAKDEDPFDLLAETLPSETPDNSGPKYTGPPVKESDATKKKAERVGEKEESIPPDYRFKEQPDPKDKGKVASSSTSPGAKPKVTEKSMTEGDVLDSLSADFINISPAPISKCSAPTSHATAPPSMQKEAPLTASTAAPVSASKSSAKDEDPFDLLAETLPSETPDNSGPKYTGPPVKESDATKKKAERVGEKEESIPPDYRFRPDPKDKGKMASSSTGPGAKPKRMTEGDVLESLSADFTQTSPTPISKCSAPTSHSAAPPSKQPQAPLKASTAASVSASLGDAKGKDPLTLLADSLPSQAPDKSGPKYTGPVVKETDHTNKKPELVGETEESLPPDYRFIEQADPKDKGKVASSSTGPGAKPKAPEKLLTKEDLVESMSSDFDSGSSASHAGAQVSKQKEAKNQPTAKRDAKKPRKR